MKLVAIVSDGVHVVYAGGEAVRTAYVIEINDNTIPPRLAAAMRKEYTTVSFALLQADEEDS